MLKILKVFFKFELEKKRMFFLFLLLLLITAIIDSVFPYFFKLLVETIQSNNLNSVLAILFLYTGTRIFSMITSALSFVVGDAVSFVGGIKARTDVFKRIQDLDFAFHSSKSTGSLISVIKRGDGAYFSLHHAIFDRIFEITVAFIVMTYALARLDIVIGAVVIISFFVNLIVAKFVLSKNISARNDFNKEEDEISAIITDNIINYETVKLFAKENWELDRLRDRFKIWQKALWKYSNSFRVLDISIGSLVSLSIFIVLFLSLQMSFGRKMAIGDFVLVLGFVTSFFPRFFDLFFGLRDIAKNYADITKYFNVLDLEVEVKDPEKEIALTKVKGEINFKDVSFIYKKGRGRAVKDINLTIEAGKSIAFVGKSGVGKTTLVRLLMRFYDPTNGTIEIDGIDIKNFSKSRLRSFMGVVPQEPILFNNTIGYNIAYGSGSENTTVTKDEIKEAARVANINEFIDELPEKYNTQVGERGVKLSGGQKQRLAIARMVLSDPDIIIFDEATSQLDSESEKLIQDAFWKIAKGKTTIIIAHRLSTVMRADEIVVMSKGRIIEKDTHKNLLKRKNGLYTKFWNLQRI